MEESNFLEYRKNRAIELKEKRSESKDNAWAYLEQIRDTEDYKEAERFYRESFAMAQSENEFEDIEIATSKTENISVKNLIEKYNISKVSEKFDRKKIEEILEKAETREEKYKILA